MGLKSLFVKGDPIEKSPTKPVIQSTPKTITPVSVSADADYSDYIQKALDAADLPGPDYSEFSKALLKLDGKPLTDADKYEIALVGVGLTWEQLLKTTSPYIGVLQDIKSRFTSEMGKAKSICIDEKEKTINSETADIERLTLEIQKKRDNINKLRIEVNADTLKLSQKEAGFQVSYNQRLDLINEHISNIKTYLDANATKK